MPSLTRVVLRFSNLNEIRTPRLSYVMNIPCNPSVTLAMDRPWNALCTDTRCLLRWSSFTDAEGCGCGGNRTGVAASREHVEFLLDYIGSMYSKTRVGQEAPVH